MTATKSRRKPAGGTALTPKQKQVLAHLERGEGISQVAKKLRITSSGVYGHIRKIKAAGVEVPSTNGAAAPQVPSDARTETPAPVIDGSGIDVPTVIRSQIEVAKEAIEKIDAEADEMQSRAELLKLQREAQAEQIARHQSALGAYQQ